MSRNCQRRLHGEGETQMRSYELRELISGRETGRSKVKLCRSKFRRKVLLLPWLQRKVHVRRGWEIRLERKAKVRLWKNLFISLRSPGISPLHTAQQLRACILVCVACFESYLGQSVILGILGNSESQVPHFYNVENNNTYFMGLLEDLLSSYL